MLGAIEAGGTKCVLAVGPSPDCITARHTLPTLTPAATLNAAAQWFARQGTITALGIGTFGPVELDRTSPNWGQITNTPKPGWQNCDIAGFFGKALDIPVALDTDVNAAAIAEQAARPAARALAYITIGTGIGGGLVIEGEPVHGAAHPEMGHILVRRHPLDSDFPGICPHHGDCLEGLACGPAIIARWGGSLSQLGGDHIAHEVIANYLAQLCHAVCALTAAEVIVLGGGVAKTPDLVTRIAARARAIDAGYLPGRRHHRIDPPHHGEDAGIIGAMMLAQRCV
ncbi:MAG: ROK family protein [Porphyrobacter sp.]|jgi:fructokinase|nr:ROK family protein [Porphyrobacter sp.]